MRLLWCLRASSRSEVNHRGLWVRWPSTGSSSTFCWVGAFRCTRVRHVAPPCWQETRRRPRGEPQNRSSGLCSCVLQLPGVAPGPRTLTRRTHTPAHSGSWVVYLEVSCLWLVEIIFLLRLFVFITGRSRTSRNTRTPRAKGIGVCVCGCVGDKVSVCVRENEMRVCVWVSVWRCCRLPEVCF